MKQLQGIVAPPVPVPQHGVFIWVQDAMPSPFVGRALRKHGGPERARHRTLGDPKLLRNRLPCPALVPQRPDLLMACHLAAPTVGRLHLRVARGGAREDRDNHGPVWPGPRAPTARLIDCLEGLAMEIEDL